MDIFTFEESKVLEEGIGFLFKEVVKSGKISIRQILLKTGGKLDKHKEQAEVIYYVNKGEGTMVINAERKRITEGMYIVCPAKAMRSIINSSSKDLSVIIIA